MIEAQVGGGSRGNAVPWRSTQTAGFPEYERPVAGRSTGAIDDQLQRDLDRVDREHEEALRRWEADLRAREEKLKRPDDDG
ncbi:hypothetical protein ACIB24_21170 [Spongisporangium articulatum]|uniref:Uncharacterized protein n=1 Tax=Spongisporangium articulatum TaxID=3362603 RepID=A0ABW8AT71_9ACTN